MNVKVCLVRSPAITLPFPPDLGIAYVKSTLLEAGVAAAVWDANWDAFRLADADAREVWRTKDWDPIKRHGIGMIERFKPEFLRTLDGYLADGFNVFGFSVWRTNYAASLRFAQLVKERAPKAHVVFGGPECMPDWAGRQAIADSAVDAVIYGEGEQAMLGLVRGLQADGRLRPAPGTLIRTPAGIVDGGAPQPVDPKALPFPDFDEFQFDRFEPRYSIAFNRGCAWSCSFCSVPGYIPTFRWRPAEQIFSEIRRQKERYGVTDFVEYSPTTNSNVRELSRLCDLVIDGGLELRWEGFAMFNRLMNADVAQRLRRAGCTTLNFGMESGSQRILDKMGKKFKVEDAERILKELKEAGVKTCLNFIVGFPGETEEDFQKSLEFIDRNSSNITMTGCVSMMALTPYSSVYSDQDEWGVVIEDATRDDAWRTRDGANTLEVRMGRRARLEKLAGGCGVVHTGDKHRAGEKISMEEAATARHGAA